MTKRCTTTVKRTLLHQRYCAGRILQKILDGRIQTLGMIRGLIDADGIDPDYFCMRWGPSKIRSWSADAQSTVPQFATASGCMQGMDCSLNYSLGRHVTAVVPGNEAWHVVAQITPIL